MDKHYTEVLIDGTIYTLGGTEGEAYLQKVAVYLNEKISQIRKQAGFSKQSVEYQALMIELNVADDYFKEQERADLLAEQKAALEKDAYSLKHELVTTQMQYDSDKQELEALRIEKKAGEKQGMSEAARRELAAARAETERLREQLQEVQTQLADAKAAASEAAGMQELAEEEAKEAKQTLEQERAQTKQLKQAYDTVKSELEQLKAIQAAAAAVSSHGSHR